MSHLQAFAEIARRIAVPAAVALVFALARKYMPPPPESTQVSSELTEEFSKLQWGLALVMILVAATFAYGSYTFLLWANGLLAGRDNPAILTLLPERAIWCFFPLFGAASLTWELTFIAWSTFGNRQRAMKYAAWSNAKMGFNATRVLRILIVFVALPIGCLTLLALPLHTSFDQDGLKIGGYASLRSTYHPYSDIKTVLTVDGVRLRDGTLQHSPAIVLEFADGSRWSSADNRGRQKEIDPTLLALLQEKTHLTVQSIEAESFGK
ncbi:hypothetical protein EDE15_0040 [Edaphobacter aggregans]|uniref:Uncharacterized protein n=1 Tax=Edaphobacter aggregans TaxID=570835 RepID=A0A3R9NVF4_9BACT|nr:hypothetical protein [Edaphobacter aggregans]RSL14588.1 hypothetical protein EDE15_0040 [Edaphobacter aggregans]